MNAVMLGISGELAHRAIEALKGDEPDVHALAKELSEEVPEDELRRALESALVPYLRSRLGGLRNRSKDRRTGKWHWASEVYSFYRARVSLDGEWKFLGDCTIEDVSFLAANKHQKAAEFESVALGFDKLAKAMKKRSAKTVQEVPEAVIEEIFSDE